MNQMSYPKYFLVDAINIICHVLNRVVIRPILENTPYELLKGMKPNISYFRIFYCKCFILNNDKDKLCKFDAKSDEEIFLDYSLSSKAYRVFNNRLLIVEEFVYVDFDESKPQKSGKGNLSSFDVSGVITEELVKDDTLEWNPPKDEDIKNDKEDSEHEEEK